MSDHPKVSIVMPVYNGGNYFELALQSALAQTYENIEILIINDGSTDGGSTDAIGREYQKNFPNKVRYFFQENSGVSGALNKGIDNMTGEYFCWLSHDDLYLPSKIERQIERIIACGQNDVLLFGDWEYIGPNGEHLYYVIVDGDHNKGLSIAAVLGGAINGCTVMIPRIALAHHRFDAQYRCTQDYRLWFELAEHLTFVRCPEVLVQQRLHPGQDTHRLKEVAISEGEALWQDMIFGTNSVTHAAIDGSDLRFYQRMAQRLAQMPYPLTGARVAEAADNALKAIKITVVATGCKEDSFTHDLAQFLPRDGASVQIIVVDAPNAADENLIGKNAPVITASNLQQALDRSEGDYIVVLPTVDFVPLSVLQKQACSMSQTGRFISIRHNDPGSIDLDAQKLMIGNLPPISSIMIHRYLIASGEFDGFDVDDSMSGNLLRIFSIHQTLFLDNRGEEVAL